MDLREYLFRKNLTVADFAKSIEFAPEYISNIKTGRKKPGVKLRKAILKATDGVITFDLPPPPRKLKGFKSRKTTQTIQTNQNDKKRDEAQPPEEGVCHEA